MITLRDGASEVLVAAERGALVARFFDGAREVLYLDEATFLDRTKNVRGGIPVLFPTPGKLVDDRWARDGKSGQLAQHGFARNLAWRPVGRDTVALDSTALTLRDYPWPFHVEIAFALSGRTLRVDIAVSNVGNERMPYGFGFHPYFRVPVAEKAGARVATDATRAWDNVRKVERALDGIDLGGPEVDLHLLDHHGTTSALSTASGRVVITGSAHFTRWVVWTLPGKDFVCLEPWTGPGNAMNTGDGLLTLAPGATERMWVVYESE